MEEKENIKLAFFLNLGFSIFEFIGGLLTNSVSIFSDAIHDFGDSLSIGVSYLLENLSGKERDEVYTYGYKRYSVFGAFITSTILIISSLVVLFNAFLRILHPVEIHFVGMFLFSVFGIAINGYAAIKTSHNVNLNEKSVNLHMLEDVLGWIAVLIGSLLIKITGWNIIDPILSIIISVFIGYKAIKNVVDILNVLLEKVPSSIHIEEIKGSILGVDKIKGVHHVHVWSMDGKEIFLTMHVLVDKSVTKKNYESVKNSIKDILKEKGIFHSTIEMEYENCNEDICK